MNPAIAAGVPERKLKKHAKKVIQQRKEKAKKKKETAEDKDEEEKMQIDTSADKKAD